MQFTKDEYYYLHEGCCLILRKIEAKLDGSDGSYFSPSDKVELKSEYEKVVAIADKIHSCLPPLWASLQNEA